ncbi:MAG TPA: DUF2062 domain-containing protein [Candidatus Babeliales bacterium]|nr:DUF2062 domain-containing protein [Candidatus Babeliales bacterium]
MKRFFTQLALKERCPSKFSLSVCAGAFIALSPFMGLHTAMIFVFAWTFRLNLPITFAVAYLNNPWTVGPLLVGEYVIGQKIVTLLGWQFENPAWVISFNKLLSTYLGLPEICFWTFIIGASVMTLVVSIILYPIVKYVFTTFIPRQRKLTS